jgi:hypothetical protein
MDKNSTRKMRTDQIRFENELKKIQLELEHDARFYSSPDANLPVEIESLWLDKIKQFEDAYKNCKKIIMYDKIGRPDYRRVNEIPDSGMKMELKRIQDILIQNWIMVDFLYEVDDSEKYRFITEDLFPEEIDDIDIMGMVSHFIYEEYYPNDERDIHDISLEFINYIFREGTALDPKSFFLDDKIKFNDGWENAGSFTGKIKKFRQPWDVLQVNKFRFLSLNIKEDKAKVDFHIRYSCISSTDINKKIISGKGRFSFENKYNLWFIMEVDIPGIN